MLDGIEWDDDDDEIDFIGHDGENSVIYRDDHGNQKTS